MYIKEGKRINLYNGMIIDDVQIVLPLDAGRLEELGITEVPDPVRPDDRFYFVSENEDGSFEAVAKDRDQVNNMVWGWIKAKRDELTENGGFKVGNKWFHSDQRSRNQQLGLVLLGDNIPAELQWKTMDGSFVTMTKTLAGQILAAGAASDANIFTVAEAHRIGVENAEDPSKYDFSTDWPEAFTPEQE